MTQTKIAWGDGTSDYFYLSYESSKGSRSVSVTSDLNKEVTSRTKRVSVRTKSDNKVKATIIVTQNTAGIGVMIIEETFAIPTLTGVSRMNNVSETTIVSDEDTNVFATIKKFISKFR